MNHTSVYLILVYERHQLIYIKKNSAWHIAAKQRSPNWRLFVSNMASKADAAWFRRMRVTPEGSDRDLE